METESDETPRATAAAAMAATAAATQPGATGCAAGATETLATVDSVSTRVFTLAGGGGGWGAQDNVAPIAMLDTTPVRERAKEEPRTAIQED